MGSTRRGRACTDGGVVAGARAGLAGLFGLALLACGQAAPRGVAVQGGEPLEAATLAGEAAARPKTALLRVGTSGDYAPFSLWSDDEPEPRGFSADVARAFARDRRQRIEWVRFRWSELLADLEGGRFEIALSGITVRPERSLAGRFSIPLTATGAVALVRDGSAFRTRADLDRPEVRLAVNRGGHLERVARTLFPRARIEAIEDNTRVAERLVDGRADAVLTDDLEAEHWRKQLPPSRAVGPLTRDLKAAWLPIGGERLARDFDRWLLRFEASGGLARLRERHGLSAPREAAPIPALLASLDERLSLMPSVARAKRLLGLPIEDRAQEERVHEAVRRACLQAAREFRSEPPVAAALRRFVDVQLRAARFVQESALEAPPPVPRNTPPQPFASPHPIAGSSEREAARRDLDQRIRPAIAFVTERIAWLIVAGLPSSPSQAGSREQRPATRAAISKALAGHALPAELEAEIHAALDALFKPPPPARTASPALPMRSARRGITPSG